MQTTTQETNLALPDLIQRILDKGQEIADSSSTPRVIPLLRMEGEVAKVFAAQGDVNLFPVTKEQVMRECVRVEGNAQLAPGNTRGSRHCIREADMHKVNFYAWKNPCPLEGPVLEFTDTVVVEHPEHRDHEYIAQFYAVGYARRHADEVRAMAD